MCLGKLTCHWARAEEKARQVNLPLVLKGLSLLQACVRPVGKLAIHGAHKLIYNLLRARRALTLFNTVQSLW